MIRPAGIDDLDALVALENRSFDSDRFSRRSLRYLLTKGNAVTLVDERTGALRGYVMVLFNVGTSLARLYSLAVDPAWRGQGIAPRLMAAAEDAAIERDCVAMRLEVRSDNGGAIALYEKLGYRQFAVHDDYYQDHSAALRMAKALVPHLEADMVPVPYYEQTLEFTCGPAALMMAMKALTPERPMDRKEELRIWRESTTVFMTSGHGGTGPYGLALAAYHRGFDVELVVNDPGALFIDSVRSEEKKEVMRLVQEDFTEELARHGVPVTHGALSVEALQERFEKGAIPVVLISSYRIYGEKSPHWVVVTGFSDRYIYVHDSFVDHEANKSATDCVNMPIAKKDFERMARYGKAGQKAVVIVRPRKGAPLELPLRAAVSA